MIATQLSFPILHFWLAAAITPPPHLRIWWSFCAILVFLMQVGFMLVETGFVRERNMTGIAVKTFLMLLASSSAYSAFGYNIMYGPDVFHGWLGWGTPNPDLGMEWLFYQTGFAAVSATILSGAIAERTSLTINIIAAALIGGVVFPVVGHWTWASDGWLHLRHFHDLAGSATVHFLGGIASATAAWIAGPRLDKYDPVTKRFNHYVGERSLPLVSCGVLFLWLGWMGFNGGSVKSDLEFQNAGFYIVATGCAASAAGFVVMVISPLWDFFLSWWEERRKNQRPRPFINMTREFFSKGELARPYDILAATMGGMVCVTGNCDLLRRYSHLTALYVGACGGISVFIVSKALGSERIFRRWGKIDDPAEAIAVHGGAGFAGILIAPFLSSFDKPITFMTQFLGLVAIGVFTFTAIGGTFYVLNGRKREQAAPSRTRYYSQTFGPEVFKADAPSAEEVLGRVHYLFPVNLVRSTKNEEHLGLRFEPMTVRAAAFPLRTAFVAEELQKDIKDFFSALVAAPIHNLKTAIEEILAPEEIGGEGKYSEMRAKLLAEVDHMKSLGILRVDRDPVGLKKIVATIAQDYANIHKFVQTEATSCFGDPTGEFGVLAQRDMLVNALRALFSNAVRVVYRRVDQHEQGYTPSVKYELYKEANRVVLSVTDNGGGVSRQVVDRLFEPFTTGPTDGGHGLGLFYAFWVATVFRGSLRLARNDLTETRFELILHSYEE